MWSVACAGRRLGPRGWRRGVFGGLWPDLGQLVLKRFDSGGQRGELCGKFTFLVAMRGLFLGTHGNYSTAIAGGAVHGSIPLFDPIVRSHCSIPDSLCD